MTTTASVLGGTVRRREDPALIRGTGRYVDDIKLTGMLHAAFVRSPYTHARVGTIDSSEAENMEGVHAVYTADDVRHLGPLLAQVPVGTATDLPSFQLARTVTPSDINPLGVKGIGEAGTIGSAQTIVNAVVDALRPLGVTHIDMPLRPRRVWESIQVAQRGES